LHKNIFEKTLDKPPDLCYNKGTVNEREVIKMANVRCPHCGSTAQVRSKGDPFISCINSGRLIDGFYCGCGCEWEHEYERNEEGLWEYTAEFITVEVEKN
jgi:hypothetical protein